MALYSQNAASIVNVKTTNSQYKSYVNRWGRLIINTKKGSALEILPITNEVLQLSFKKESNLPDTNWAVKFEPEGVQMVVKDMKEELHISSGYLSMILHKKDMSISYYYKDRLLTEHENFDFGNSLSFKKMPGESFWGMGNQDELNSLNGGHYEFSSKHLGDFENSIPILLSSRDYLVFFDNSAIQAVDIARKNKQKILWSTDAKSLSFYLIGGNSYRSLMKSYFQMVGNQDIPPLSLMGTVKRKELVKNQFIWDNINAKVWNLDTLVKKKIDTNNCYLKYQALNAQYRKLYANKRLYHLRRHPFIGASDYSILFERKLVDNSWSSFKTLVPALLHISVSGIPFVYTVVGNDTDEELNLRKFELSAFSPLFVYEEESSDSYSEKSKSIITNIILERRKLVLYFYTLAWQQATLGELLIKPTFFNYPQEIDRLKFNTSFLLGNNLLVFPIVNKNIRQKRLYLPHGKWYGYYSNRPYQGGATIDVVVNRGNIPVFVKAGTFLPKISVSKPYESDSLWLTYFPVGKAGSYNSRVYDDDGKTVKAWKFRNSEIMNFQAVEEKSLLTLTFRKQVSEYKGRHKKRRMIVQVLQNGKKIKKVYLRGKKIKKKELGAVGDYYSISKGFITVCFEWDDKDVVVELKY